MVGIGRAVGYGLVAALSALSAASHVESTDELFAKSERFYLAPIAGTS